MPVPDFFKKVNIYKFNIKTCLEALVKLVKWIVKSSIHLHLYEEA